ncbi:hypothetical protein, partial [Halomonas sp. PR-M31]|uniref:hypothetical protein n=1 Tax=Halomonas sp. PR-M31 TaxID=1471202 RepID=UPI001C10AAD6
GYPGGRKRAYRASLHEHGAPRTRRRREALLRLAQDNGLIDPEPGAGSCMKTTTFQRRRSGTC